MSAKTWILGVVLLSAVASAALAAPLNGCVEVRLAVPPPEENPTASEVRATLTNKCGKDITAFRLLFRDAGSGRPLLALDQELLDSLESQVPGADIFRASTSRTLSWNFPDPSVSAAVTAALFLDRSVFGDSDGVRHLLDHRARVLQELIEESRLLDSVADWNAALELHTRADEAKKAKSTSAAYLENLARELDRSNAVSWETFVGRERKRLLATAALFKEHLGRSGK